VTVLLNSGDDCWWNVAQKTKRAANGGLGRIENYDFHRIVHESVGDHLCAHAIYMERESTKLNFILGGAIVCCIVAMVILARKLAAMRSVMVAAGPRSWHMTSAYGNYDAAAQRLAAVNTKVISLLRVLKKKYHIDETDDVVRAEGASHRVDEDKRLMVGNLVANYNPDAIYENDPSAGNGTSYTLNKGERMYVCLRDKTRPGALIDENTLVFTVLHECAHIANYNDIGHTVRFWEIFKFILQESTAAGIYTPVDYGHDPVEFCGLQITYQPLYDNSLRQL